MLGVGYDTTSLLVRGGGSLLFDAEAFGTKILGFTIAAAMGLLGGTFAPSLFIGASLGALVGHAGRLLVDVSLDSGAYALVGMGAYFAGTLRAPIAAVLIVVELTNDYGLIIPLMLAVSLSQLISHSIAPHTLEEDQLSREGVRHAPEPARPSRPSRSERRHDPRAAHVHSGYTDHRRHRAHARPEAPGLSRRRREGPAHGSHGGRRHCPLRQATTIRRNLASTSVDRCPVVDANGTVVGFVSPSDLMRARFREQPLIGEETLR